MTTFVGIVRGITCRRTKKSGPSSSFLRLHLRLPTRQCWGSSERATKGTSKQFGPRILIMHTGSIPLLLCLRDVCLTNISQTRRAINSNQLVDTHASDIRISPLQSQCNSPVVVCNMQHECGPIGLMLFRFGAGHSVPDQRMWLTNTRRHDSPSTFRL